MPISDTLASELTFSEIIIGVVFILILVAFWQRVLENLLYNTINLNKDSTYQSFIIAVSLTVIFLVVINLISSVARNIILGSDQALPRVGGSFPSEDDNEDGVEEAEPCGKDKSSYKRRKKCWQLSER